MVEKEVYNIDDGRKLLIKESQRIKESKKNNHPESKLQIGCITWFRVQYPAYQCLLFAIPNGGARSAVEAKIMSAEGIVPGVADLLLAVPKYINGRTEHHAFFIEMKATSKYQTPRQKEFMNRVRNEGFKYEVCRSFDQFMNMITDYLR